MNRLYNLKTHVRCMVSYG